MGYIATSASVAHFNVIFAHFLPLVWMDSIGD